jgi:hypothetical protein
MKPTRGGVSTRKADGFRFGLLGAATFALLFWLQLHWLDVAAWLMGRERIIFDEQAEWIRGLKSAVDTIPWLIGAALLVFAAVRRRWVPVLAFAGSYALGLGLVVGALFGTPVVDDYASRTAFESASWKAENRDAPQGVRVHMVDDLLRTHKLVGMTRAQLEDLLGVPPATEYFREYDYVYWLGPERGLFSIDSEWLVVKCSHGVVISAQVVTD